MAENPKNIYGVKRTELVEQTETNVDTRSWFRRKHDELLLKPEFFLWVIGILAVVGIGIDLAHLDLMAIFLAIFLLFSASIGSKKKLTFRTPISHHARVEHNFNSNKSTYYDEAENELDGVLFFGVDVEDGTRGEELWFSASDITMHMLLFGTTGAGKTEALLSLCYGALLTCSGFIFTDGKGTPELYQKVHNTCKMLGQDDDLLLMSFLVPKEDSRFQKMSQKVSNTLNPVAKATADASCQLLVSLMASNGGGDGGMWADRAAVLMESVMTRLVWLRDYRKQPISIETIRQALVFSNFFNVWQKAQADEVREDPEHTDYLPEPIFNSMDAYLKSLPGFNENKNLDEQSHTVAEQHGYLFMQFSKLLGSLADMYGYIFNTQLSEIDFWDIVTSRRVLVILLPALAKSKQELSMLGKIVLACIKQMMAVAFQSDTEGLYGFLTKRKPTSSRTPCIIVLDEFGYYAVPGAAVMPAQARSLGFFMIFAGQDFPAFSASGKEEAEAIVANCKIQVCMALQDQGATFAIFRDKAGKGKVYVSQGKQYRNSGIQNQDGIVTESKDIIDFKDLTQQGSGYGHFLFEGKMARGRFFYAQIPFKDDNEIVVNQFVKVAPPSQDEAQAKLRLMKETKKKLLDLSYHEEISSELAESFYTKEIKTLKVYMDEYRKEFSQVKGVSDQLLPTVATTASIAHYLHEAQMTLQSSNNRKKNTQINGTQVNFADDSGQVMADFEQYKNEYQKNQKTAIKPYAHSGDLVKDNYKKIQSVVSENEHLNQRASDKAVQQRNSLVKYPSNKPKSQNSAYFSELTNDYEAEAKKEKA